MSPVDVLHGPAMLDKLHRQPVQQLRMRGSAAARSKVARRGHQAAAEMILPDAVDHHARRERIIRAAIQSASARRLSVVGFSGIGPVPFRGPTRSWMSPPPKTAGKPGVTGCPIRSRGPAAESSVNDHQCL